MIQKLKAGQIWEKSSYEFGDKYDFKYTLSVKINKISKYGFMEGVVISNNMKDSYWTHHYPVGNIYFTNDNIIHNRLSWRLVKDRIGEECCSCYRFYNEATNNLNDSTEFLCWECEVDFD